MMTQTKFHCTSA